jgi:hypothetical protein
MLAFIGGAFAAFFFYPLTDPTVQAVLLTLSAVSFLPLALSVLCLRSMRCPRCRQRMCLHTRRGFRHLLFCGYCSVCGLTKWDQAVTPDWLEQIAE